MGPNPMEEYRPDCGWVGVVSHVLAWDVFLISHSVSLEAICKEDETTGKKGGKAKMDWISSPPKQ